MDNTNKKHVFREVNITVDDDIRSDCEKMISRVEKKESVFKAINNFSEKWLLPVMLLLLFEVIIMIFTEFRNTDYPFGKNLLIHMLELNLLIILPVLAIWLTADIFMRDKLPSSRLCANKKQYKILVNWWHVFSEGTVDVIYNGGTFFVCDSICNGDSVNIKCCGNEWKKFCTINEENQAVFDNNPECNKFIVKWNENAYSACTLQREGCSVQAEYAYVCN